MKDLESEKQNNIAKIEQLNNKINLLSSEAMILQNDKEFGEIIFNDQFIFEGNLSIFYFHYIKVFLRFKD